MDEIEERTRKLRDEFDLLARRLRIFEAYESLQELNKEIHSEGFWRDNKQAQRKLKLQAHLENKVKEFSDIDLELRDVGELVKSGDVSLKDDLNKQLDETHDKLMDLKKQLKFNGPYDNSSAILSIHAGAGGTDAQDWAQMLLRMYTRWAEKSGYTVKTLDQSAGDEAGLKSATLAVEGNFAYGKLQGEHGVHRLVRLSPFNADNLRQTSFAKVEVLPEIDTPDAIRLDDKDLKIDVYRSGGHGGQSVNTTDSAVRVTHLPTGLTVAIQNERSQLQNKETALTILRSRLAQLQLEQHAADLAEIKGPNEQAAWGNQIRNYVLHPYKQVKDLRTKHETSDPGAVLDGDLDPFINTYLEANL